MPPMISVIGQQFGELVVLEQKGHYCYCKCSCGNILTVRTHSLRQGYRRSCGCKKIKTREPNVIISVNNDTFTLKVREFITILDVDDMDLVLRHYWDVIRGKNPYIYTKIDGKMITISHLIINSDNIIDHINRNSLDNRKSNLRVATIEQNNFNRGPHTFKQSSVYKGVYKSGKKWMAKIKSIYLGTFETELEAAKMYDKWAKMLYGTFAYINVSKTG